jgi:hypothetical protein
MDTCPPLCPSAASRHAVRDFPNSRKRAETTAVDRAATANPRPLPGAAGTVLAEASGSARTVRGAWTRREVDRQEPAAPSRRRAGCAVPTAASIPRNIVSWNRYDRCGALRGARRAGPARRGQPAVLRDDPLVGVRGSRFPAHCDDFDSSTSRSRPAISRRYSRAPWSLGSSSCMFASKAIM